MSALRRKDAEVAGPGRLRLGRRNEVCLLLRRMPLLRARLGLDGRALRKPIFLPPQHQPKQRQLRPPAGRVRRPPEAGHSRLNDFSGLTSAISAADHRKGNRRAKRKQTGGGPPRSVESPPAFHPGFETTKETVCRKRTLETGPGCNTP